MDRIILRCNTLMPKENFEQLKKEWEAQDPAILVIPCSMEVIPPIRARWIDKYGNTNFFECSACGHKYHLPHSPHRFCPNCGARMEEAK